MSISVHLLSEFLLDSVVQKYVINYKGEPLIDNFEPLKKTPDDSEVSGFKIITADKTQILVCVLSDKK